LKETTPEVVFRRSLLTVSTIVAACAFFAAPGTAARQTQQQPAPVFRSRVDSISVNVTVTDKQGKPVTDLKPEEFEIREAGTPQAIDSFRFIQTPVSETRALEPPRQILSQADMSRETANPQNRIFLIFLDDYHTREANSIFVRKELADWVRTLTSRDLVALLYPWQHALAATFSVDHEGTAAAIRTFKGRKYDYRAMNADEERFAHRPREEQEQIRNEMTTRTLQSACAYLATLRDGRKTLLFVSEGMFAELPAGVRTISDFAAPTGTTAAQRAGVPQGAGYFRSVDLLIRMRPLIQAAARGNTAIYPLDPRGLTSSEFVAGDSVGGDAGRNILAESIDGLRIIADETDGRAFIGRNTFLPDLQKMVEEVSAYYLLGYTSTFAHRDGKFHEIQVRVNRKDVEVRARKGYWAYTDDELKKASEPPKPGLPTEVNEALAVLTRNVEPASRQDVLLWIGSTRGEAERAQVTLAWEAPPGILSSGTDRIDQISVVATAGSEAVFKAEVPRDPAALRPSGRISFPSPAGSIRIRVTPQNARGQKLDTIELSHSVPDYSSPTVTLTSPQIYRGRTAFDLNAIRKAASPIPSASRLFSRTERLIVRFDAFGAGTAPPAVKLRLLSREGKPLMDLPAPTLLSGNQFEAEINLNVCNPPGDFILEFTASSGTETSVTLVAIRVRS